MLLALAAGTACVAVPEALAQPPYTLTITNTGTDTGVSCTTGTTTTCVPIADNAILTTATLDSDLNNTPVVVGDGTSPVTIDDSVSGTNTLELAGPVTTSGTLTLQAPTVSFDDLVSGTGDLTVSGNAGVDDGLSGLGAVVVTGHGVIDGSINVGSLEVDGSTNISGSVTTTGAQIYSGAVTLTGDSTLTSTGSGSVTFDSTVDGAHALTVNTGGTTTLSDAVGGSLTLLSLSVLGAGGTELQADASTTGDQTYTGAVTVSGDSTLTSTGNGTITFDSTVDGGHALTVNTGGNTSFNGAIGGSTALSSLSTLGAAATTLSADVATTGDQTYSGAVTLGADSTVTSTSSGSITFDSTVDGAHGLTANTGGNTTFTGAVGGNDALASLTTQGAGSTILDGNVSTTGTQTYSGSTTLSGTSLSLTGSTVTVPSGSTLDGATNLSITGNAAFDGTVGTATALTSVSVSELTTLAGPLTTTGDQTYTGAVTLTGDSTLTSTGSRNVTFDSTVDGAHGLTINTAGNTTFTGAVGSNDALASLTTQGAGSTNLDGNVSTTGDQTYGQPVTLQTSVKFSDGPNNAVNLEGKVSGAGELTMAGAGTLALADTSDDYSGGTKVTSGTMIFGNGSIPSSGTLTLNGGTLEWANGNIEDISLLPLEPIGANGATLNTNGNDVPLANPIQGTSTLTKAGLGTLSLTATSASTGNQMLVTGGTLNVAGATVTAPITVQSGATLSCTAGGTLSGGINNDGGTLRGAPSAPTVESATDAAGSTASVDFSPGAATCLPVSYVAQASPGGSVSSPGASSPLSVGGLAAATAYAFTVTATNPIGTTVSGNSKTVTTPSNPSISIGLPSQVTTYLFNQKVDASYSCSDDTGPGISSCQGTVQSGAAFDTSQPGAHSFSVTTTSSDGYSSTQTITYQVAEPLQPLITIVSPSNSPQFKRGQVVDANYSCMDSTLGTGIASCRGPVASGAPLNTSAIGKHTFTVVARSRDGATRTLTVAYTVAGPSNAFTFTVSSPPHAIPHVSVAGMQGPGQVRVTVRTAGVPVFSVTKAATKRALSVALTPSGLRSRLARSPKPLVHVAVTYTPRGGKPHTESESLRL
ncbi:MAG TPA: hypothetical protein VG228_05235 [Solirubrobacteraceae bacterium]|nr:hypothetical protein [Solirubrobacteraceae bacterium]